MSESDDIRHTKMNYTYTTNGYDFDMTVLLISVLITLLALFAVVYLYDLSSDVYEKKIAYLNKRIHELEVKNEKMNLAQDEHTRLTDITKQFVESFADTLNSKNPAGIKRRRTLSFESDD